MFNNHFKTIFVCLLCVSLFSCVNTKKLEVVWVSKNQVIYEATPDSSGGFAITKNTITEPLIAKIVKRDSILVFTVYDGKLEKDTIRKHFAGSAYKGLFFPFMDFIPPLGSTFASSRKLTYLSSSPVFQALTIPLKVRFETDGQPYVAEASINFGVALGWKFTHHEYRNYYHRKTGLFVSSDDNHYSLTPGIFIGPGIIELTPQNSLSADNRNVLSFTYGTMLVFGFNRLNIGVALGFDNAIGNGDKNWIYQSKPWLGATISFDLIQ